MSTKIGVLINFNSSVDITAKFQQVKELELQTCQVNIWDTSLYTDENAEKIINASKETGEPSCALAEMVWVKLRISIMEPDSLT